MVYVCVTTKTLTHPKSNPSPQIRPLTLVQNPGAKNPESRTLEVDFTQK